MQDVLPIPVFSLPLLAALGYGWTVAVACGMSWLSPAWVDRKRSFSEQVFSGRKFCFSKPNPSMCNSASRGRCVLFFLKNQQSIHNACTVFGWHQQLQSLSGLSITGICSCHYFLLELSLQSSSPLDVDVELEVLVSISPVASVEERLCALSPFSRSL